MKPAMHRMPGNPSIQTRSAFSLHNRIDADVSIRASARKARAPTA